MRLMKMVFGWWAELLGLLGFFGFALVKGVVGRGSTLHINVAGSPTLFLKIGNITDITGPGGQGTVIDVSNLDSVAREKLMGLFDEGQLQFNINLDPGRLDASGGPHRAAQQDAVRIQADPDRYVAGLRDLLRLCDGLLAFARHRRGDQGGRDRRDRRRGQLAIARASGEARCSR
jgi:hypothetical protein